MAQEKRERIEVIRSGGLEQKQRVVESAPSTRQVFVARFIRFLWVIASIVVVLLATRFIFVLIGANPDTEFVRLIYRATDGIVMPFNGIVNTPGIDVPALIAMFFTVAIFWLITTVFRLLFGDTRRIKHVTTVDYKR